MFAGVVPAYLFIALLAVPSSRADVLLGRHSVKADKTHADGALLLQPRCDYSASA